jgi:hypothetical protein
MFFASVLAVLCIYALRYDKNFRASLKAESFSWTASDF